jgi:hypothetical protein
VEIGQNEIERMIEEKILELASIASDFRFEAEPFLLETHDQDIRRDRVIFEDKDS